MCHVSLAQPPEFCTPFQRVSLIYLISDLVDRNSESWLNVGLHILLLVVAEKACSFYNGIHFFPTLRVTSQLLWGRVKDQWSVD